VFAAPSLTFKSAKVDVLGNCAYPNVPFISADEVSEKYTVQILKYFVGSHWVAVFIDSTEAIVAYWAVVF